MEQTGNEDWGFQASKRLQYDLCYIPSLLKPYDSSVNLDYYSLKISFISYKIHEQFQLLAMFLFLVKLGGID